MQVEALNAAAAALALVSLHGNDDGRAAVALHQTAGHNSGHAGMKGIAPHHQHPVVLPGGVGVQLLIHPGQDLLLRVLPVLIALVQPGGQIGCPLGILAQQQLQRQGGAVHPAGRVQARSQRVADGIRRHRSPAHTADFQQGLNARPPGILQCFQPAAHQRAVFPGQVHHVRHRSDGRQIAAEIQQLLRRAAVQRAAQLEGHACA